MNDLATLRELRPEAPPAELETMRMSARDRFVAGTALKPARPRWRRPVLAGGITTVAAAAGVATALILTSGPGAVLGQHTTGHAGKVVTTAWTVSEDADGTVSIYLQQYADPSGLQQTLQADGVNAIVRAIPYTEQTFLNPDKTIVTPTCNYVTLNDREPLSVQGAVLTVGREALPALFVIHPAAIPPGSALFLAFMVSPPNATGNIAMKPVVLSDDTAPACVPVTTKPASGASAPPIGQKAGSPAPHVLPKAA